MNDSCTRRPQWPAARIVVRLALGLLTAGCGGDDGPRMESDAGTVEGVQPRFDLEPDPMPFGAIPFPDDLYLDERGHVDVGELPGEAASVAPELFDSMRLTLRDLDGFGAVSPVFFTFDGDLDPASLPETLSETMAEDASVFLVDVDPGSPTAFARVPVRLDWEASLRQLAIRPADGHPLAEGRRYAAVLTRRVRSIDGRPLVADPDFAAVRDAANRPSDPLLAQAHDQYAPVLASLASHGVRTADVVGLAVFRVQTTTRDLSDARTRIWERDPPVVTVDEVVSGVAALDARLGTPVPALSGLDLPGGVQHDAIGWMIHGRYESPWLISDEEHVHGRFERDEDGRLRIGRTETVPFTLLLPRTADLAAVPVLIFQHGVGGDRSQVLGFANALAGAGYAILAVDAPFHGLRSPVANPDDRNRFTGAESPDGFGDRTGAGAVADFAGIDDSAGELVQFHPVYLRDSLRQGVVDLLSLTRLVRETTAWDAVRDADPGLASLAFAAAPLGFVGYSMGGMIGTMFTAVETEVGASVLAVTGGFITNFVVMSPPFNQAYVPLLWPLLGLEPTAIDYEGFHPLYRGELAIVQTLLDRGDPINYGAAVRGRRVDTLLFMAKHDETLHNVATESLARAIGAPMVAATPSHTDLQVAIAPVRGNVMVSGEMATRALYVHEPATHGLLMVRTDEQRYAHPVEPPFELAGPREIANPIDGAIGQMLHFFESWRSGTAEVAVPAPD